MKKLAPVFLILCVCFVFSASTPTQNIIVQKQQNLDYTQLLEASGIIVRDKNNKLKLINDYEHHPAFDKLPQEIKQRLTQPTEETETSKNFQDAKGNTYKVEYYKKKPHSGEAYKLREKLLLSADTTYEKTFSPEGALIEEGTLIRGKIKHGDWKKYAPQGKLVNITTYENGIEVTINREIITVYDNSNNKETLLKVIDSFPGQTTYKYFSKDTLAPTGTWSYFVPQNNSLRLTKTEEYADGNRIKQVNYFLSTGTKQEEFSYKNNVLDGVVSTFDPSENIIAQHYYKDGIEYYKNGHPMYANIVTGNQQLTYHLDYFEDGTTKSAGYIGLRGSQGPWYEYAIITENTRMLTKEYFCTNNIRAVSLEYGSENKQLSIGGYNAAGYAHGLWVRYLPAANELEAIAYFGDNNRKLFSAEQLKIVRKDTPPTTLFSVYKKPNTLLLQATFTNGLPEAWWVYYVPTVSTNAFKKVHFSHGHCDNAVLINNL